MAWLTERELKRKAIGTNENDLPPDAYSDSLRSSQSFIVRRIGTQTADEVEAADANSTVQKIVDLRNAQKLLAQRELLQIRSNNNVLQERDETGNMVNQFMTPQQVEVKRTALLADALELIEPYQLSTVSVTAQTRQGYSSRVKVASDW